MDVQECIHAYLRLSSRVFSKVHHRVNLKGQIQGRFDHEELERAIKQVITEAGYEENALLKDESPGACKV